MTWEEMSPEQRDALVHLKVMGSQCPGKAGMHQAVYPDGTPPTTWWYCRTCEQRWSTQPGEHVPVRVPHYTTSMDAAWQVLHRMAKSDMDELQSAFAYRLGVTYVDDDGYDTFSVNLEQLAEWTPESLCLAALRAVGYEDL